MKINRKYSLLIASLIGVVFAMSSCLKNGSDYVNFSAVNASVDLPLAASTNNGVTALSFDPSVTSTTIPIYVDYASPNLPTSSTTITLAIDTAGLTAYNTANGTNYVPLPDSVYTIPSLTVTIPAGKRLDSVVATVNLSKLDLSQPYVLPITIASAPVPIEQWNHLFFNVAVKNMYDGQYSLNIKTVGWAAYGIADGVSYTWPSNVSLVTSGARSVTFSTAEEASFQPAFTSAGATTGFGATEPQLTFDANNNLISVTNLAAPDSRNRTFHINPAVTDSRYDPSSQTIYAAYIMSQTGRVDQMIYDTLTYVGPR